jgi:hypothetical protein
MRTWNRRRKKQKARKKEKARKRSFEESVRLADSEVIKAGLSTLGKRNFSICIGPTNSAGQASLWSRALTRQGFPSQSLRISNDPVAEWFDADVEIPRLEWTTREGRLALAKKIASEYEAMLFESMRPLFSLHSTRDYSANRAFEDIKLLKRAKVKSAIVFHGSDIRDTTAHARRERFSPYRRITPELEQLALRATDFRKAGRRAIRRRIPVFVTTPDLFLDMPRARWLPVTIDVDAFANAGQTRRCWSTPGPPKVLFQPSKAWLKSADVVLPTLKKLEHEGIIDLLEGGSISHDQMALRIADADIVIDRFDGVAGVASVEALAARRIVIANIAPWAYKRAEVIPPVVHATPDTLESVLRKISSEGVNFPHDFEAGLLYAQKWHDGSESARRIVRSLRVSKRP